MTPLEALRAIGCTDDGIRSMATLLTFGGATPEGCDEAASGEQLPTFAVGYRLNAAILRAAEQLGPEREWVTRDTPIGTEVGHDDLPPYRRWLVGLTRSESVVTENEHGMVGCHDPQGWYVVKGAEG